MSSDEGLIQALQVATNDNYIDVAVFAVVLFDWLLTSADEMHIMWKRPLTGAKVLFLLNRYFFIAFYVTEIMSDLVPVSMGGNCPGIGSALCAFSVLHNVVVSGFLVLRVYAISGRSRVYGLLMSAFVVFPIFFSIYSWAKSTFVVSGAPFVGCSQISTLSEDAFNNMLIAQRVCLIAADAMTVLVTIYQTYGTIKAGREANVPTAFSSTLLHAGIFYFVVMLVMNTVQFIVQMTSETPYFQGVPALFDYLMISHFLLNLQDVMTDTTGGGDLSRPSFVRSTSSQMSTIRFADSIIGNLGGSLRDGSSYDDDSEDTEVDEDGMAMGCNTENHSVSHKNVEKPEEPVRATFPSSNAVWEENNLGGVPVMRTHRSSRFAESEALV